MQNAGHDEGAPDAPRNALMGRYLLVLGAMFCFGLMGAFTREANASIIAISAWRAVFVALVFAIWSLFAERKPQGGPLSALATDAVTRKMGVLLGVALAVASSTFVAGYALTTMANTIFLHNLAPVVVFPLAWWAFREQPSSAAVAGAGIALSGVALLSGVSLFQVAHFANPRFLLGDLLATVSALGWGSVLVIIRASRMGGFRIPAGETRQGTPILATMTIAWTVAALILCTVAMVTGQLTLPGSAVVWVIGLAVVSTNIPFYLLNLGMAAPKTDSGETGPGVDAGMASVLSLAEVLFASAVGMIIYGEHLAPIGWVGGLLAGLGVLYAVSQQDTPSQTHDGAD